MSKPDKQPESNGIQAESNKQAFVDRLRPIIEKENRRLRKLKRRTAEQLAKIAAGGTLADDQDAQLQTLASRYRVEGDILSDKNAQRELLQKIDEIPVELALAQAANESAWGNSRFAREGNNLFGIWTYDESKGMVPRNRAPGKTHLVRVFDSEADSVRYYMHTLNSHPAYAELRRIRTDLRSRGQSLDGLALAEGLLAYSAKGEEYVRVIRSMIRRFEQTGQDARLADKA
ncbi:MAG: glucosaminidase domain-containing protein [Gammaproteobacteria bacterium]|nr:glucosaminidase domain-containing protein [Gammaproteobacteria bacterium]